MSVAPLCGPLYVAPLRAAPLMWALNVAPLWALYVAPVWALYVAPLWALCVHLPCGPSMGPLCAPLFEASGSNRPATAGGGP